MGVAQPPENPDPAIAEQFARIRRTFILGLFKREAEIEQATTQADLTAALHRLAGAAGSFGFQELSELARQTMDATVRNDEVHFRRLMIELKQKTRAIRDVG